MLLTRHARERVVKRLARKRKLERIYSVLWDFIDRSQRIEVNDGVVILTNGEKSLVCARLECERLSLEEIQERVSGISRTYDCVFLDGRRARSTVPRKFVEGIPEGEYCFYLNREKRSLYVGSEEPLLVITMRPAKERERVYASRGTTSISPKGSS
ncbi:hypothetical protein [Thermococcus celer]|uniref:Uncharacterized protein n=1 Tax=Thermococcus celer Vu 13 = JCM 8558 TaxID=1293037 RepID=A0A218P218_THECE|nr:hypothetical protein [Thermococcus celer]ASI98982.1 hypothetical protein A3L02_05090 [Thermococcus celer Vu 13 = JCM 8558]